MEQQHAKPISVFGCLLLHTAAAAASACDDDGYYDFCLPQSSKLPSFGFGFKRFAASRTTTPCGMFVGHQLWSKQLMAHITRV